MRAGTGNAALIEYNDLVGVHNSADTLCNNDDGGILCVFTERAAQFAHRAVEHDLSAALAGPGATR